MRQAPSWIWERPLTSPERGTPLDVDFAGRPQLTAQPDWREGGAVNAIEKAELVLAALRGPRRLRAPILLAENPPAGVLSAEVAPPPGRRGRPGRRRRSETQENTTSSTKRVAGSQAIERGGQPLEREPVADELLELELAGGVVVDEADVDVHRRRPEEGALQRLLVDETPGVDGQLAPLRHQPDDDDRAAGAIAAHASPIVRSCPIASNA